MDAVLLSRLQHEQSKAYLRLMLSTATNMDVFEHEVGLLLEKLGVTNYGGLLPCKLPLYRTSRVPYCKLRMSTFATTRVS